MKSVKRGLVLRLAVLQLAILLSVVGAQAQSQSSQKRLVQIDETTGELVEVTPSETAQTAPQAGIVILNNQKSTQSSGQAVIQDQPTNVIEDSPLTMSSAERRRRERQSMELQTEQKIVEKLEEARIEDERARGDRLFNQGFGSGNNQPAQPQVAPQTVQVIQAPRQVVEVAPVEKQEPKVNVKEEIRAALDDMKPKRAPKQTSYYVQGLVGIGEYPDAINVRGNLATGFSFGMVTPERLVAEGTFQYSEYDIEEMQYGYSYFPPFKSLSQYNFSTAIKYQILGETIRPVIGGVAGYTYRSYQEQQYYYTGNIRSVSTNAFDVGALVGLDLQLTDSFAVGFDFRWMWNVTYGENSDYQASFVYPRPGKAVEELSYYLGSLTGKFTF
jgi:hypothetical protein